MGDFYLICSHQYANTLKSVKKLAGDYEIHKLGILFKSLTLVWDDA